MKIDSGIFCSRVSQYENWKRGTDHVLGMRRAISGAISKQCPKECEKCSALKSKKLYLKILKLMANQKKKLERMCANAI